MTSELLATVVTGSATVVTGSVVSSEPVVCGMP